MDNGSVKDSIIKKNQNINQLAFTEKKNYMTYTYISLTKNAKE
jgi:hypothetical protein